jgi:hypothetical protein
MKVKAMQVQLGKAKRPSVVRTIPVAGAVYPFHGPKQPITFGPRVTQSFGAWLAQGSVG